MARTVLDSQLDSRTARARLQIRVKPYFRAIDPGLHLAYRRNITGGTWNVRMYLGGGRYQMALLGTAADLGDADGTTVLNFSQAQAAARARYTEAKRAANGLPEPSAGPYTVDRALDNYFTWLEGEGRGEKNIADARAKAKTHIRAKLGHVRLDRLTAKQVGDWLHALAKAPPRTLHPVINHRRTDPIPAVGRARPRRPPVPIPRRARRWQRATGRRAVAERWAPRGGLAGVERPDCRQHRAARGWWPRAGLPTAIGQDRPPR